MLNLRIMLKCDNVVCGWLDVVCEFYKDNVEECKSKSKRDGVCP